MALVLMMGIAAGSPAFGFISARSTQSGADVHWNPGSHMVFRVNENNIRGLSASSIFSLFTTSLQRWKQAAFNGFNFTYYQGSNPNLYPTHTGAPQDNSIFFTSQSSEKISCGVIALTSVWFDPGSGTATKADLRFNDDCFALSTNPRDTGSGNRVYLGDVATHELGHALGLDHSQSLQSSMIFTATQEMATPSCDDQAAMVYLYGPRSRTGILSGRIASPAGYVFGAHVSAINLNRGVVMASALSDKDGSFHIRGLEQGSYGILVEPYYPGAGTLGQYYSSINRNVCNGSSFDRTFLLEEGHLKKFHVNGNGDTATGTIQVDCDGPSSANGYAETSFSTAPQIANGGLSTPVGTQSVFTSTGQSHYYYLGPQTGTLRASALSYSIFSSADVQVEFLNGMGQRLTQTSAANSYASGTSNYVNYDASSLVVLSGEEEVYVRVSNVATISSTRYPSGSVALSNSRYYVLTVSNNTSPDTLYPANARCAAADNFGPYPNQGEAPGFASQNNDDDGSGGCGTLVNRDGGGSSGGGRGPMNRLLNFVMLAAALAVVRALSRPRTSGQTLPRPI